MLHCRWRCRAAIDLTCPLACFRSHALDVLFERDLLGLLLRLWLRLLRRVDWIHVLVELHQAGGRSEPSHYAQRPSSRHGKGAFDGEWLLTLIDTRWKLGRLLYTNGMRFALPFLRYVTFTTCMGTNHQLSTSCAQSNSDAPSLFIPSRPHRTPPVHPRRLSHIFFVCDFATNNFFRE